MAYASKYCYPQKAHEYYEKHKKLMADIRAEIRSAKQVETAVSQKFRQNVSAKDKAAKSKLTESCKKTREKNKKVMEKKKAAAGKKYEAEKNQAY